MTEFNYESLKIAKPTGATEGGNVAGKWQTRTAAELKEQDSDLPFPPAGIHPDVLIKQCRLIAGYAGYKNMNTFYIGRLTRFWEQCAKEVKKRLDAEPAAAAAATNNEATTQQQANNGAEEQDRKKHRTE